MAKAKTKKTITKFATPILIGLTTLTLWEFLKPKIKGALGV